MTWADLDAARKAQGLTKRELSRRAGRHERAFSSAMLGERGASSMSAWADFCRVLGVEAPWPGHTERDDPPWRHGTIAWEDLDRIREERGLSKSELSRMAGKDRRAFSHAMLCIPGYRSEKAWADFARALGVDAPPPGTPIWSCPPRSQREGAILKALAFDISRARAEIPIPPRSTFTRGKRYEIRGSMRGSREADASWMSHTVVTYLRKEGVHHMFRGPGGWLTAWTDAQLVGKRVTSA